MSTVALHGKEYDSSTRELALRLDYLRPSCNGRPDRGRAGEVMDVVVHEVFGHPEQGAHGREYHL